VDEVLHCVPAELRPAALPGAPAEPAVRTRFLAAHAFGNWTAHLGDGLQAWLRSIDAADELAATIGVRDADHLLRHLADPWLLAKRYSAAMNG
jgi:hypothetical protein